MNKTKKCFAVLLAVVMMVMSVPSAYAYELDSFPVRTKPTISPNYSDKLVADEHTQYIARISQDPDTKLITANMLVQNNGSETLSIGISTFCLEFSDDVVPVHKDTKVPFNGATLLEWQDVAPYFETVFVSNSSNILSLDRNPYESGRYMSVMASVGGTAPLLVQPGEEQVLFTVYFKPTDIWNPDVDLSMFNLVSKDGYSNVIGLGVTYLVQDDEGYVLNVYDYFENKDSFSIEME